MRGFLLSLFILSLVSAAGSAFAGKLAAPGPNPAWTEMQKFEWYLGYLARAAQVCGSYDEAGVLNRLARMSPYGDVGLGAVMADGFAGPVCGRINNSAKELAADAGEIERFLEATYDCSGEECFGQSLKDWKFHDCADELRVHLFKRDIEEKDLSQVTISNVRHSGATLDYTARVRLKSCQGSLYVDLDDACKVDRDYTRGDCEVAGVDPY